MRPRFTSEHKRQLRQLGVTVEQIEALETKLLHIRVSAQSVPVSDVRKRLQNIADAAHALADAINQLDHDADVADSAAAWRLYETHSDRLADDQLADPLQALQDNPDPQVLRVEVERLESIANAAMEPLRGKQARAKTGNWLPVSWIDDALLDGWCNTHTAHLSDADLRSGNYPPLPPEYPFRPSRRGRFRKVVAICYRAAGHPTKDPELAVRRYLTKERERFVSDDEGTPQHHPSKLTTGIDCAAWDWFTGRAGR